MLHVTVMKMCSGKFIILLVWPLQRAIVVADVIPVRTLRVSYVSCTYFELPSESAIFVELFQHISFI